MTRHAKHTTGDPERSLTDDWCPAAATTSVAVDTPQRRGLYRRLVVLV